LNQSTAARIALAAVLLVAPFEPRFTLPAGPLHLSLVEAVALPCFLILAVASRRSEGRLLGPPLMALVVMMHASLISASLAAPDPGRAFKFALRLGAMFVFALLVSRQQERDLRFGLGALATAGALAAILAVLEGAGLRSIDVLLGAFREIPFNVAGIRRASAGSEYPNLGAAMIFYALLAGVTLFRGRPWFRAPFVLVLTAGLACTYSRGAWMAGLAGLCVTAWFERDRGRLAPLALYLGVLGLFVGHAEISRIRFEGENANDFYAATYDAPRQFAMDPSQRVLVPVTVRNVGRRPWRKAEEIHLSYHLYQNSSRPLVDGPRTDLPKDVLPGETVTFEAALRAPAKEGDYLLMWDLVHEDTTWFSGQGVKPGLARLVVGRPRVAAAPKEDEALARVSEALAWRPSRLELWRLAVRMWASNPFFGIGPDNYRWTYGTLAGKAAFDTRVFSNNMFLEFAATLGTFGLAAFVAALVLALRRGWRGAPGSEVGVIGLSILVAMTVHGLADYLLAFTGHYLVFGLALGVLSRPRA
jgi:O-antigen ligase